MNWKKEKKKKMSVTGEREGGIDEVNNENK